MCVREREKDGDYMQCACMHYLAHEARSSGDENCFALIQFLYIRQLLRHFDWLGLQMKLEKNNGIIFKNLYRYRNRACWSDGFKLNDSLLWLRHYTDLLCMLVCSLFGLAFGRFWNCQIIKFINWRPNNDTLRWKEWYLHQTIC